MTLDWASIFVKRRGLCARYPRHREHGSWMAGSNLYFQRGFFARFTAEAVSFNLSRLIDNRALGLDCHYTAHATIRRRRIPI
jgi:hypothetical protein